MLEKRDRKRMIVLYGRRRVGKTTLLKYIFKRARYFFVDTRNSKTLLKDFSRQLLNASFVNWEEFFKYLLAKEDIVIFDEFQKFLRVDPSVLSILQKVWDEIDSNVFLVLSGSYSGMMKKIFLDTKSPLFGRADYLMNLRPFDFLSVCKMLGDFGYSFEETILWYTILGGVPRYLWYLEIKQAVKDKLWELFFEDFASLKDEGKNLLIMEFGGEHVGYFSILEAIGNFDRELSEIADRTGMERTTVMKYIHELVNNYEILEKVRNFLSKRKRGVRYRIKDNFLRFWYRFVYSQMEEIEFNSEHALNKTLSNLSEHVGLGFEDIVKELLPLLARKGIIPTPEKVGKHWGRVPDKKGESYEIDIVAECEENLLLVECKWTSKPLTQRDVEELIKKGNYLKDNRKKLYMMVSKSGFRGVENKRENLILLGLKELEKLVAEG